jgi:hypothetical protein
VPYPSLAALLRAEPGAIARGTASELWRFASSGSPQLLGTWLNVLLLVAGAFLLFTSVGRPADREPRSAAGPWLLASLAFFVLATAASFFTWGRLLLVLLPGCSAIAALALTVRPPGRCGRLALLGAGAFVVAVLAVKTFVFRLPAFSGRHPYREVAALRALDARLSPGTVLAGSSPFVGRYLTHRYVDLPDAFGAEVSQPALYYRRLDSILAREGVDYVVIGETDLRDRPSALVTGREPVPGLALLSAQGGVAEWRVEKPLPGVGHRLRPPMPASADRTSEE